MVSWNVRSLGESSKRDLIRKNLGLIEVDWVGLQEIKLRSVDRWLVNQICGRGDWGFCFSASIGSARALLCC